MMLHQHVVRISSATKQLFPQVLRSESATLFIDLSFGSPHHTPWYNIPGGVAKLQQFGLWLEPKGETGFWLQVDVKSMDESSKTKKIGAKTKQVSLKNAENLAKMVCEVY